MIKNFIDRGYSITILSHSNALSFLKEEFNENKNIYLGSISYDNSYGIIFHNNFLFPTHKINKNIDKSREFFKEYLLNEFNSNSINCKYIDNNCAISNNPKNEKQSYYTDGKILFCEIKK